MTALEERLLMDIFSLIIKKGFVIFLEVQGEPIPYLQSFPGFEYDTSATHLLGFRCIVLTIAVKDSGFSLPVPLALEELFPYVKNFARERGII